MSSPAVVAAANLTYTLPAVGALAAVARPLTSRRDAAKTAAVCAAAFVWACARHRPDEAGAGAEAVARLVAQAALTALWAQLVFRWTVPCAHFNMDAATYATVRWAPIAALAAAFVVAPARARPCPAAAAAVVAFMWYGAGNFFARRPAQSCWAVAAPASYLCWARDDVHDGGHFDGHFNGRTAAAQCWFHVAASLTVVLAVTCLDKAAGLMDVYPTRFPVRPGVLGGLKRTFRAFVTPEHAMPADAAEDLMKCVAVTRRVSKTFGSYLLILQGGARLDIMIMFLFGRVADEVFDSQCELTKKKRLWELYQRFLDELFADRKSDFDVKRTPQEAKIDWAPYESEMTDENIAIFRALARIAYYLPAKPFYEMFEAGRWDLEAKTIQSLDDVKLYSYLVSGSNAALCVYATIYRDYNDEYYDLVERGTDDEIVKKAYQMGEGTQFMNIARDIVADSVQLGRCYVPPEFMDDAEAETKILREERDPRRLGDEKLKRYAEEMIRLSDRYQSEAEVVFRRMPRATRSAFVALVDIYRGYIPIIRSSPTYPTKARMTRWQMTKIALYSLYVRSLWYAV